VIDKGQPAESGFDPRRVLKITAKGVAADDFEKIPGLSVVAEEDGHFLVVFATDDGLREFKSRLAQLEAGELPTRKELLYAVQALNAITRDDRMGAAYRAQPPIDGQIGIVDVELWPVLKFREMIRAFAEWCKGANLSILDSVQQPSLVLLRIKGPKQAIERMLEHRDVRVVDLPPRFQLERSDLEIVAANAGTIGAPSQGAPVIGIIDSGIASNHPLLAGAVADAQSYLEGQEAEDENGHGTAVSGLALYGDIYERSQQRNFTATFWLASANALATDLITKESVRYARRSPRRIREST